MIIICTWHCPHINPQWKPARKVGFALILFHTFTVWSVYQFDYSTTGFLNNIVHHHTVPCKANCKWAFQISWNTYFRNSWFCWQNIELLLWPYNIIINSNKPYQAAILALNPNLVVELFSIQLHCPATVYKRCPGDRGQLLIPLYCNIPESVLTSFPSYLPICRPIHFIATLQTNSLSWVWTIGLRIGTGPVAFPKSDNKEVIVRQKLDYLDHGGQRPLVLEITMGIMNS